MSESAGVPAPGTHREMVLVATPTVSGMFYASFAHQCAKLTQRGRWVGWQSVSRKPVDLARQFLAELAVKDGYTHVLWLDDDVYIPDMALEALLAHRKPMVSAVYYGRTDLPVPMAYRLRGTKPPEELADAGVIPSGLYNWLPPEMRLVHWYHPIGKEVAAWAKENADYLKDKDNVWTGPRSSLVEVDAVGFGCVLTEVSMLADMMDGEEGRPLFVADFEGGGEDFYFCRLAKSYGFPIHVELGIQANHVTRMPVGREEFQEAWLVGQEDEFPWEEDGEFNVIVGPNNFRRIAHKVMGK